MCDCEDFMPQVCREQYRTARKAHRCCECGLMIERGDRYRYVSGIWDHQASDYHQCVQCGQVWDFHERRAWAGGHCGPRFTLLYDEIPLARWPAHALAARAARIAARATQ